MKKYFLVLGALVSTSAMAGLDPTIPMNVHTPTTNWSGIAAVMNAKRALREQEMNEQREQERARQEQEMNALRIQILEEQLRQMKENAGE